MNEGICNASMLNEKQKKTKSQKNSKEVWEHMCGMLELSAGWKGNPFNGESELLPNGTIHWKAKSTITDLNIMAIYEVSNAFKRRLNINTGTHGMPDGSTIFYHTPKF